MKNIRHILLAFFLFTASINAQDFGDLMDLANETFGEEAETNVGSWEEVEKEIDKKLEDPRIKELMGHFSEAFNKFADESQTGKCLQLMGAYAEMLAYCDMRAETEGDPCKRKDWYGIESMILFMGTSISYCPQEFYGLANFDDPDEDEQIKIVSQYEAEINVYFFGNAARSLVDVENKYFNNLNSSNFYHFFPNSTVSYEEFNKFSDLDKQRVYSMMKRQYKEEIDNVLKSDPHLELYFKFFKANEQLNLNLKNKVGESEVGWLIDFVSKMFTPGYQISKALEIASESSSINCNN